VTRRAPLVLAVLAAVAGCAPRAADELADDDVRRLARLSARIDAEIGGARAGRSNLCRVLPLGVTPCGVTRAYRAYSAVGTDEQRLRALAAEYDAVDRERNARLGLVPDPPCPTVDEMPPPPVALEGGRCVLRPADP
jgi:hypothetical protein